MFVHRRMVTVGLCCGTINVFFVKVINGLNCAKMETNLHIYLVDDLCTATKLDTVCEVVMLVS